VGLHSVAAGPVGSSRFPPPSCRTSTSSSPRATRRSTSAVPGAAGSRGASALGGARIGGLGVTANASQVDLDLTSATVTDLTAVVNVGQLTIQLPAGSDVTGDLRVGGGELRVCTRPGLGLRVATRGFAEHLAVGGADQDEDTWLSA